MNFGQIGEKLEMVRSQLDESEYPTMGELVKFDHHKMSEKMARAAMRPLEDAIERAHGMDTGQRKQLVNRVFRSLNMQIFSVLKDTGGLFVTPSK